ncbi:MAG: ATP-binding protein, partial [Thermocladium sp.]
MRVCREVEAECLEVNAATPSLLRMQLLGRVVQSGEKIYTCNLRVSPNPCLYLDTDIQLRRRPPPINLIMRDDVAILRLRERSLIYDPKIMKMIMRLVVEPLRNGEPPLTNLILAGFPGTGKTELGRAIAEMSGATLMEVDSTQIMSKWVGESAKRLDRIIIRAASQEPAILEFSDVDSISAAGSRTDNAQDAAPYIEVRGVLINRMDELRNRRVAFVITTNRSLATLDPAIKRRAMTIIMTPPTPPMINAYIQEARGGSIEAAVKKWGRDAVRERVMGLAAGGATWGIIESTLRTAIALDDINATQTDVNGLGYSFISTTRPTPLPDAPLIDEFKRKMNLGKNVRIVPTPNTSTATSPINDTFAAVAGLAASMAAGRLIIQVTRSDYAEDAAATAQQTNAVLLVPPTVPPQTRATLLNYPIPIIFMRVVDEDTRKLMHIMEISDAAAHYLAKLAAALFDVQCDDKAMIKASRIPEILHLMNVKRMDCATAANT